MMQDNLVFLRDRESGLRWSAANTPETSDGRVKRDLLDRADRFKSIADELERLRAK